MIAVVKQHTYIPCSLSQWSAIQQTCCVLRDVCEPQPRPAPRLEQVRFQTCGNMEKGLSILFNVLAMLIFWPLRQELRKSKLESTRSSIRNNYPSLPAFPGREKLVTFWWAFDDEDSPPFNDSKELFPSIHNVLYNGPHENILNTDKIRNQITPRWRWKILNGEKMFTPNLHQSDVDGQDVTHSYKFLTPFFLEFDSHTEGRKVLAIVLSPNEPGD